MPLPINSLTSSVNEVYSEAAWDPIFETKALLFFSFAHFSKNTSVACAKMIFTRNLTTSRLRSVDGAWRKFSLMYVSIPAQVLK